MKADGIAEWMTAPKELRWNISKRTHSVKSVCIAYEAAASRMPNGNKGDAAVV